MKSQRKIAFPLIMFLSCLCLGAQSLATLNVSRDSAVKIVSQSANSSGSGFLIGDQYVMTCFHVVFRQDPSPTSIFHIKPDDDLQITFKSGETIGGYVVTIPTPQDTAPMFFDFAIVKLAHLPTNPVVKVELAAAEEQPEFGGEVAFSGFPLATPGMVTHRGMISGSDPSNSLIFIEASINRGNSGGALLNSNGHVIGIVSMREGGIGNQLEALRNQINNASTTGQVRFLGVDPLQSTNAIINTLDQYISTGIGYARSIKFAREYLQRHPELLK